MLSDTRTARMTGVAYLGLVAFGSLGFLVLRPHLRSPDDPAATLANILENSALAHFGVGLELLVVTAQALAAFGFYALFRNERPTVAYGVATFGMANASALLVSAAALSTAVHVANNPALAPAGDAAATVGLLYNFSDALWTTGGVFFGLWLIPMGWFMISTRRMPYILGVLLVVGGAAYLLSAMLTASVENLPGPVSDALVIPATVGELWTVGYLLIRGIRPLPQAEPTPAAPVDALR